MILITQQYIIRKKEGTDMKDLSYYNKLYDLRKSHHLTQQALADAIEIDRRTISLIENGRQNPSLEIVYRLATYFEIMIPDIFPLNGNLRIPTISDSSYRVKEKL